MKPNRPRIAITLGDPAGIGPEIVLKAVLSERVRRACRPMLVGDRRALALHAERCGLAPRVRELARSGDFASTPDDEVVLLHRDLLGTAPIALGTVDARYGLAGIESGRAAVAAALAGDVDAVIAAPQHELAIKAAGIEFDGNPSFLARCTGTPIDEAFLMLCFDRFRITHVTAHLSLANAIRRLSVDLIGKAIRASAETLRRIGIAQPRIAVSGVNPHAGEGGLFGTEEIEIIAPAVRAAAADGLAVEGPFGADIMFNMRGFDAYVVMVHDQGHVLAKTLAPNRGAALSIGTPVLFSSVAHGTAFDIAGRNLATPDAVIEAVERLTGTGVT